MIKPGSSPVDWCEPNYAHNSYIAEFFNTISNIPVILLPLIGLWMNKFYLNEINPLAKLVYLSYFFVGISSAYYHATLSLFGQLLDELGILWVITVGFIVWLPGMNYVPKIFKTHCQASRMGLAAFSFLSTFLSVMKPSINAYVLMTASVPLLARLLLDLKVTNNDEANKLWLFCIGTWGAAVSVWLSDRMMCSFWQNVGFPYVHALWHIVSAFACYDALILCSFLDAQTQTMVYRRPRLKYMPRKGLVRLPYVHFDLTIESINNNKPEWNNLTYDATKCS